MIKVLDSGGVVARLRCPVKVFDKVPGNLD
ncbi:hypothetical protein ABMD26_004092 [Pseudomonas sp. PvP001]|jgi:hypothetical protein